MCSMRILRKDYIIHPFTQMPREGDIDNGYVTVITDRKTLNEMKVLYTTTYGWNTCGENLDFRITKEGMADCYFGWISEPDKKVADTECWLDRIEEMIEEVELKRREDPQKYETESEGNYWASLDELLDVLEQARDFAREVA